MNPEATPAQKTEAPARANAPANTVVVVRTLDASADNVYAAWTNPTVMRRWLATVVETDLRVGGRYRIAIHEDDGTVNVFTGEYQVLEPGRRIVKTFRHHSAKPGEYVDEFVDVTLRPLGPNRTELTLVNGWTTPSATNQQLEAVKEGFNRWLDLLEAALGQIADR